MILMCPYTLLANPGMLLSWMKSMLMCYICELHVDVDIS